jgi:hypothetical protein
VILSFERLPDGLAEIVGAHRPDVFDVSHNTVHLRLRDEESRVLELVAALSKKERVLRVEINGASLEDVFVALTRGAEETR